MMDSIKYLSLKGILCDVKYLILFQGILFIGYRIHVHNSSDVEILNPLRVLSNPQQATIIDKIFIVLSISKLFPQEFLIILRILFPII
jgi:hypothetical protein